MSPERSALECMLEARSVALVGASSRPGSLGERALIELTRSPNGPEIHLVNPRYTEVAGRPCLPSLDAIGGPVDLVLLAVGDDSLEAELARAAARGDRSAVIFANAVGMQGQLAAIAEGAGMAVCGGGCMGFVSPGVRALGYLEPSPLRSGGVALVTHSGSAFSALLRADRGFGWSLAVSSGQELATTTGEYVDYALSLPATRVVALLLETLRAPHLLRAALSRAAAQQVTVVALTVGASEAGRAMVAAHSGALAGSDGAWEALFDAYGVLRVSDLPELCDTLEIVSSRRRPPARGGPGGGGLPGRRTGLGAVLDSGAERALVVDVASSLGVPFAEVAPETLSKLGELLDPGLEPANPVDVWGRGASTEELFRDSMLALAGDAAVDAVALAVDLVPEYDGDESYREAVLGAAAATTLPVCVLSHVPSALDREAARRLRDAGIPVLEGTRSGLVALGHLLAIGARGFAVADAPSARQLPATPLDGARAAAVRSLPPIELLEAYGIASPTTLTATDRQAAIDAAIEIGFPVVMKTAASIAHKTEAGGVILGVGSAEDVSDAYDRLAKLGRAVTISATAPPGVELSLGIVRDPLVGPLVVLGAGGALVELLADRAVALPPLDGPAARRMLGRLKIRRLLDGYREQPPADVEAVERAVIAMSQIAVELGDSLDAIEVNPLSCSPAGVLALDVLVEWRS